MSDEVTQLKQARKEVEVQLQRTEKSLKEQRQKVVKLERELRELKSKSNNTTAISRQELEQLRNSVSAKDTEITKQAATIRQLEQQLDESLEASRRDAATVSGLEEEKMKMVERIALLSSDLHTQTEEVHRLGEENKDLKSEVTILRAKLEQALSNKTGQDHVNTDHGSEDARPNRNVPTNMSKFDMSKIDQVARLRHALQRFQHMQERLMVVSARLPLVMHDHKPLHQRTASS